MQEDLAALAVLLGLAAVAAAEPKADPDTTGWQTLFAGDLSDATFPNGVWSIADGLLSATKDECIWTKKQYENFTLDLEFKTRRRLEQRRDGLLQRREELDSDGNRDSDLG